MDDVGLPERVSPGQEVEFASAVDRHFHENDDDHDPRSRAAAIAASGDYRAWVVRSGASIVGNLGVLQTDLSLPGATAVSNAAITAVGVSQTYRRRGILRSLIGACLDEAVQRGEVVATLYASEAAIYPRFGFGPCTVTAAYRVDTATARFRDPVDTRMVVDAPSTDALAAFPAAFERFRSQRASVGRVPMQWQLDFSADEYARRRGASTLRVVQVVGRGYAAYRIRSRWDGALPAGVVEVRDLVAADPEAEAALWQHVCGVDLTSTVVAQLRPTDEALPELLMERTRARIRESLPLYCRLLDIPAAFMARSYQGPGTAVFGVEDERVPGRKEIYRLEVDAHGAHCERIAHGEPELALPIDVLSSVWLGGRRTTQFVAARRAVELRVGAAAALDRLLAAPRHPSTPFIF